MRLFVYSHENKAELIKKIVDLQEALGFKIKLEESQALGFLDKKITILTFNIKKDKQTKDLANFLLSKVSSDLNYEKRIDDSCNFYLRLDKLSFLDDEYLLTEKGDCVHFTFNIAAYPKNKDVAIKVFKEFLEQNHYK